MKTSTCNILLKFNESDISSKIKELQALCVTNAKLFSKEYGKYLDIFIEVSLELKKSIILPHHIKKRNQRLMRDTTVKLYEVLNPKQYNIAEIKLDNVRNEIYDILLVLNSMTQTLTPYIKLS